MKGSDGGHNGMKNIIYLTGSDQIPRIKIGGERPKLGMDPADWVLSKFSPQEKKSAGRGQSITPAPPWSFMVNGKAAEAMNKYNS